MNEYDKEYEYYYNWCLKTDTSIAWDKSKRCKKGFSKYMSNLSSDMRTLCLAVWMSGHKLDHSSNKRLSEQYRKINIRDYDRRNK